MANRSVNNVIIWLILVTTCSVSCISMVRVETILVHPAVIINSAMEDNLPLELKNDFYKNPSIAASLAQESWLSEKEIQVMERETDKIPREKIYTVLHNAGFARR